MSSGSSKGYEGVLQGYWKGTWKRLNIGSYLSGFSWGLGLAFGMGLVWCIVYRFWLAVDGGSESFGL